MSARLRYTMRVLFSRLRRPGFIRYGLLILGPLVLALVGAYQYAIGGRYISTENAYVKADKIAISTDVSGRVVKVFVQENELVQKDAPLFQLDREPFEIAVAKADAHLHTVRTELKALQELYVDKKADYAKAIRELAFFEQQFDERRKLMKRGVVSQDRFDTAARNLEASRNRIDGMREELGRIKARLGGVPNMPIEQIPEVREALARTSQAKLDLARTMIRAPATGIVTKNDLQVGEYVTMGRPVFSIVGWRQLWVEANLKETELTYVNEGQSATITVDAYPDFTWQARVASIAPATGAEFSILPPQNATGNWVKVVQRIPVRLELTSQPEGPPLRAGMSVIATIDTEHERDLPPFIASAVALIRGKDK